MTERYDEELFLGYLESELTPERAAEFEKRMVDDPRLRNLVAHLVLDRHRLRNLPREDAPPEVFEAVQQKLERHMLLDAPTADDTAAPRQRLRMARWAVYSGLAALVVITAGLLYQTLSDTALKGLAAEAPHAPPGPALASADRPARERRSPSVHDQKAGVPASREPAGAAPAAASPSRGPDDSAKMDGTSMDKLAMSAGESRDRAAGALSPAEASGTAAVGEAGTLPDSNMEKNIGGHAKSAIGDAPAAIGKAGPPAGPGQPTGQTGAGLLAGEVGGTLSNRLDSAKSGREVQFEGVETARARAGLDAEALVLIGQQLRIASSAPDASERDVRAWARRHRVQVLPVAYEESSQALAADLRDTAPSQRLEETKQGPAEARELTLVLAPQQVEQLVRHLNAPQQTQVMSKSASDRAAPPVLRQQARLATPGRMAQLNTGAATRPAGPTPAPPAATPAPGGGTISELWAAGAANAASPATAPAPTAQRAATTQPVAAGTGAAAPASPHGTGAGGSGISAQRRAEPRDEAMNSTLAGLERPAVAASPEGVAELERAPESLVTLPVVIVQDGAAVEDAAQ